MPYWFLKNKPQSFSKVFLCIFYVRHKSDSLQILQKQKYCQETQTFFTNGFKYQIFSDLSPHWERFCILLKHAYTIFKKKTQSGCGAASASYFSGLIMKNILAIIFCFYLINSLFYGGFCTKLDLYGLPYSLMLFEVYVVNKQINEIMNRHKVWMIKNSTNHWKCQQQICHTYLQQHQNVQPHLLKVFSYLTLCSDSLKMSCLVWNMITTPIFTFLSEDFFQDQLLTCVVLLHCTFFEIVLITKKTYLQVSIDLGKKYEKTRFVLL